MKVAAVILMQLLPFAVPCALAVYGAFETRRVPRSEPILATKCPGRRYRWFCGYAVL
jgi:hypothetical protein